MLHKPSKENFYRDTRIIAENDLEFWIAPLFL